MKPVLSVLICSIPSRWEKAKALYKHITSLSEGLNIEILLLMDNKKRSIGEKREALKNISNGDYFMFVDDDDTLYSIQDIYVSCIGVDVVSFKSKALNADGSSFIVTMGLGNPVEHNNDGQGRYTDLRRPPFTQCAWHEKFKSIPFPAINYGEDWGWVEQALKIAKSEVFIDQVIHGYNFDPKISEATL